MTVPIPTLVDVLIVTATMSLMFVSLIFWANVQRQIFRELGGMPAHIVSCVTWVTLLVATFALSLLRSANEVSNTPWFFRIYAAVAILVLVLYPVNIAMCEKNCRTIESNFKTLWRKGELPTMSEYFLTNTFCEEFCENTIKRFVQTYCQDWAQRMLKVWGTIVVVIVASGIWHCVCLWRQRRRRKEE